MVAILAVSGACGRAPNAASSTPSNTIAPSPSPSPTSSPTAIASPPAGWQVYRDDQFGFSIFYPPGFVVDNPGSNTLPAPWLRERRVVDKQYQNVSPPGQIDIGVYSIDADTLTAWVQKHTGPCGSQVSNAFFWDVVRNLTTVTAAGRQAVSFDWDMSSCGASLTVHETAFFMGSAYVFRLDWWALDPAYATTLQQYAQQILATFQR